MDYRRLGNTTLEVSEIGMGCEGFVDKNEKQIAGLVDLMEREGVNYLDLYTPNPQVRSGLGKALRGRRERFLLQAHLCTIWKNGQYERTRNIQEVKAGFEDCRDRHGPLCGHNGGLAGRLRRGGHGVCP